VSLLEERSATPEVQVIQLVRTSILKCVTKVDLLIHGTS
jgi:hypothetical protein